MNVIEQVSRTRTAPNEGPDHLGAQALAGGQLDNAAATAGSVGPLVRNDGDTHDCPEAPRRGPSLAPYAAVPLFVLPPG